MKAMLFTVLALAFAGACGDSSKGPQDAGAPKDGSVTIDASCFDLTGVDHPSHYQIINACTTADKIYKDSHPPLQNPDGSLPPLPQ
jgi:hypothetical protein